MILAIMTWLSVAHASFDCERALEESVPIVQGLASVYYRSLGSKLDGLALNEDDLAAEFLVATWKALRTFDESKGELRGYIARHCKWRVRDLLRRSTKMVPLEDQDMRDPKVDLDIDQKDEWSMVLDRAHRLASKTDFNYFYLYGLGMNIRDIADFSGVLPRRVRKGIQTVVERVRETIHEKEVQDEK
jgi:DNA-directed RNA polymerase specialized sigma24 family protein